MQSNFAALKCVLFACEKLDEVVLGDWSANGLRAVTSSSDSIRMNPSQKGCLQHHAA